MLTFILTTIVCANLQMLHTYSTPGLLISNQAPKSLDGKTTPEIINIILEK